MGRHRPGSHGPAALPFAHEGRWIPDARGPAVILRVGIILEAVEPEPGGGWPGATVRVRRARG